MKKDTEEEQLQNFAHYFGIPHIIVWTCLTVGQQFKATFSHFESFPAIAKPLPNLQIFQFIPRAISIFF